MLQEVWAIHWASLHVGLASRHGLLMWAGVDHHHGELVLQQVVDRFPVDAGALHGHVGYPVASSSQSDMASRPWVMVEKVRVCWPSGVMTQATTDLLCTSRPQPPLDIHGSPSAGYQAGPASQSDIPGWTAGRWPQNSRHYYACSRLSGATFKRACRPPGQIPARVRGSNDNRPPHRPAQPHFHTQTWPEGHRQFPRKLVLDPIGGGNPENQAVRRPLTI